MFILPDVYLAKASAEYGTLLNMQSIDTSTNTTSTLRRSVYLPWLIWFLGAFFYFYENIIQVSPGVMVQDLMNELSLDASQLGILAGVYFYTYAFIQIPAGILADNYNVRFLLLGAISLCVIGCMLFGASHGLFQAAIGRLLIGLGSGFAAICSMKLATFWFPNNRFPFLVGLMVTLGMSGSIVGGGPLALLVDKISWRSSIYLLALLGVILVGLVLRYVRIYSDSIEQKKSDSVDFKHLFHGLFKVASCKQSWYLAIYGGFMFAPTSIFGGLWGVPYIMSAYSVDKPIAASLVSLLFVGWVIGGPLSGLIAGNMPKKRPLMLGGTIGSLTTMCFIIYFNNLPLPVLSALILGFGLFSSCFLPSFSIIKELHGQANSGAALGFMNTANMMGGAIGLPLVGWLLNYCWDGTKLNNIKIYSTADYIFSLSILPIMISISLGLVFLINEKK